MPLGKDGGREATLGGPHSHAPFLSPTETLLILFHGVPLPDHSVRTTGSLVVHQGITQPVSHQVSRPPCHGGHLLAEGAVLPCEGTDRVLQRCTAILHNKSHTCMYPHAHMCAHTTPTRTHTQAPHARICMHACTPYTHHAHTHACTPCSHMYAHMYPHAHAHTCMHTCSHTCTDAYPRPHRHGGR